MRRHKKSSQSDRKKRELAEQRKISSLALAIKNRIRLNSNQAEAISIVIEFVRAGNREQAAVIQALKDLLHIKESQKIAIRILKGMVNKGYLLQAVHIVDELSKDEKIQTVLDQAIFNLPLDTSLSERPSLFLSFIFNRLDFVELDALCLSDQGSDREKAAEIFWLFMSDQQVRSFAAPLLYQLSISDDVNARETAAVVLVQCSRDDRREISQLAFDWINELSALDDGNAQATAARVLAHIAMSGQKDLEETALQRCTQYMKSDSVAKSNTAARAFALLVLNKPTCSLENNFFRTFFQLDSDRGVNRHISDTAARALFLLIRNESSRTTTQAFFSDLLKQKRVVQDETGFIRNVLTNLIALMLLDKNLKSCVPALQLQSGKQIEAIFFRLKLIAMEQKEKSFYGQSDVLARTAIRDLFNSAIFWKKRGRYIWPLLSSIFLDLVVNPRTQSYGKELIEQFLNISGSQQSKFALRELGLMGEMYPEVTKQLGKEYSQSNHELAFHLFNAFLLGNSNDPLKKELLSNFFDLKDVSSCRAAAKSLVFLMQYPKQQQKIINFINKEMCEFRAGLLSVNFFIAVLRYENERVRRIGFDLLMGNGFQAFLAGIAIRFNRDVGLQDLFKQPELLVTIEGQKFLAHTLAYFLSDQNAQASGQCVMNELMDLSDEHRNIVVMALILLNIRWATKAIGKNFLEKFACSDSEQYRCVAADVLYFLLNRHLDGASFINLFTPTDENALWTYKRIVDKFLMEKRITTLFSHPFFLQDVRGERFLQNLLIGLTSDERTFARVFYSLVLSDEPTHRGIAKSTLVRLFLDNVEKQALPEALLKALLVFNNKNAQEVAEHVLEQLLREKCSSPLQKIRFVPSIFAKVARSFNWNTLVRSLRSKEDGAVCIFGNGTLFFENVTDLYKRMFPDLCARTGCSVIEDVGQKPGFCSKENKAVVFGKQPCAFFVTPSLIMMRFNSHLVVALRDEKTIHRAVMDDATGAVEPIGPGLDHKVAKMLRAFGF